VTFYVGVIQAFMERLGLWGDGAMFSSFETFLDTTQKKGLGTCLVCHV